MADKKPAAAAPAAADKPKLPLVPIIGASAGSALLVAGLMFFMMPKPAATPADGEAATEEAGATDEPLPQTRYVEIKEPLVVNLSSGPSRFLQVQVQLATRSEEGQKAIEAHLPAIRSALLVLLRQTTGEQLAAPDAMVVMQKAALDEANRVIEAETRKKDTVSALLFTSFVTQ